MLTLGLLSNINTAYDHGVCLKWDVSSLKRLFRTATNKETNSQPSSILDAISAEGLFEAARLASPILPQYHPKQLIVLLNAGKTKRVKAILLHVLIALKVSHF